MKALIRELLDISLSKLGYYRRAEPEAHSKDDLLRTFYCNLGQVGFYPNHIIDIGANRGSWTKMALNFFPNAHVTMFEPQHWLSSSFASLLENPKITYYPYGVGDQDGTFAFTLNPRDDSSSFRMSESDAQKRGFEQQQIQMVKLNSFLPTLSLPNPDMIKIDAEGLDLKVLEGASDYFGQVEIFLVEAAISNPNFENNIHKVISYMNDKGYKVADITDLNRPFGIKALWLVELAFIRTDGFLDTAFKSIQ